MYALFHQSLDYRSRSFAGISPQRSAPCERMAGSEEPSVTRLLMQTHHRLHSGLGRLTHDARVAELLDTWLGQYLSSHPFLALTLMLFLVMSTVPIGLFLMFAAATILAASVGAVILEGVVLCLGGATLLCVLCCLAIAAFMVSAFLTAVYITGSTVLHLYYTHRFLRKEELPASLNTEEVKKTQ
ncbi:lipid droplet assembly factor 1-like isoform X2 [Brienomyrus brachyistius]|uniref:lipid droplet assembly factor 1-like isoform X2 n=1 Tax=Brienomyrus brachyistius TaxID=42636 RepID=UPI0020B396C2|nr:lipid droplet assembly factor 1-like isoform X2 [Brienomyrus brachyistius]